MSDETVDRATMRSLILVALAFGLLAVLFLGGVMFWPDEDGKKSESVFASLAAVRVLDDVPLEQEQDLLDRMPTPAWDFRPTAAQWQLKDNALTVLAKQSTALLHLGKITRSNWTYRATLHPAEWSEGIGVYWGFTEGFHKHHRYRFQGLRLFKDEQTWRLERIKGVVAQYPGRQPEATYEGLTDASSSKVGRLTDEQQLEITVREGELQRVRLGGTDHPPLTSPAANANFQPEDYQGIVGTLTTNVECSFHTVQFIVHGSKKSEVRDQKSEVRGQ